MLYATAWKLSFLIGGLVAARQIYRIDRLCLVFLSALYLFAAFSQKFLEMQVLHRVPPALALSGCCLVSPSSALSIWAWVVFTLSQTAWASLLSTFLSGDATLCRKCQFTISYYVGLSLRLTVLLHTHSLYSNPEHWKPTLKTIWFSWSPLWFSIWGLVQDGFFEYCQIFWFFPWSSLNNIKQN